MAIAFRASATATESSTTLTINKPTGTVENDVLVAVVHWANAARTLTLPSGWALEIDSGSGSSPRQAIARKVAGASEPSSYTFTFSGTVTSAGSILAYSGVDTSAPVDVSGGANGTSTNIAAPSITTTVDGARVIVGNGIARSTTVSTPSGTTSRAAIESTGSDASMRVADYEQALPGATGAKTSTAGLSGSWVGQQIALAPGNNPPNASTLVTPANAAVVNLAAGFTSDWIFNDADTGDSQSAYAMRRKVSGAPSYEYWNASTGSWQATEVKNSDVNSEFTFVASKWSNGVTYNWSVKTWDASDAEGVYASDFVVTGSTPPTGTIILPLGSVTDTLQPRVEWTYSDPEGDARTGFQIIIESGAFGATPGSGTQDYDSGEVTSTLLYHDVTTALSTSKSYRTFLRVRQTGGLWSNWDFEDFNITLDAPPAPTLAVTPDPNTASVTLDVQGHLNLLSTNQASLETDTSGWGAGASTTIARSIAQGKNGSASLELTNNNGGVFNTSAFTPTGLDGIPVIVGEEYTAVASYLSDTTVRLVRVELLWYDNAGALVSSVNGSDVTEVANIWIQASVVAVAPAGAAFATVRTRVVSTAAGEVHYVDEIGLFPGKLTPDGLRLPGTAGHYASTPDYDDLDVTSDMDLRFAGELLDWNKTGTQFLVNRGTGGPSGQVYGLVLATGNPRFLFGDGAAMTAIAATADPPFVDNEYGELRTTFDADNGAGGYDVEFFYRLNPNDEWTQLGATVTTAGANPVVRTATVGMNVGGPQGGGSALVGGIVHTASVRDGIDGDVVFDVDFTDPDQGWETGDDGGDTGIDETGKVVTINGADSRILGEWSRGGLLDANPTLRLERSDDGGETWKVLRDQADVSFDDSIAQTYQFVDYEAPPNVEVLYRARQRNLV